MTELTAKQHDIMQQARAAAWGVLQKHDPENARHLWATMISRDFADIITGSQAAASLIDQLNAQFRAAGTPCVLVRRRAN
jgi:hypothetical protein